ncbi:TPA: LPXTG cell wall anchor domain-containing protein, partial [Enterococcus faecalis ADL-336]|nr:LPXTG cell wall anchor domain-containing protein [Enterococcus faecalis ADL-336]
LPRTGTKQQQMFNYLGIIVILMASFILKKRKKEQ